MTTTAPDQHAAKTDDHPFKSQIRGTATMQTQEAVSTLMGLKTSDLDSFLRTVRNAIAASQADLKIRYVGATMLRYFIVDEIDSAIAPHVAYIIEPSAESRIPTIWVVRH